MSGARTKEPTSGVTLGHNHPEDAEHRQYNRIRQEAGRNNRCRFTKRGVLLSGEPRLGPCQVNKAWGQERDKDDKAADGRRHGACLHRMGDYRSLSPSAEAWASLRSSGVAAPWAPAAVLVVLDRDQDQEHADYFDHLWWAWLQGSCGVPDDGGCHTSPVRCEGPGPAMLPRHSRQPRPKEALWPRTEVSSSVTRGHTETRMTVCAKCSTRAPNFQYSNYSVPKDDPVHNAPSKQALRDAIKQKMSPCQVVLIMGRQVRVLQRVDQQGDRHR